MYQFTVNNVTQANILTCVTKKSVWQTKSQSEVFIASMKITIRKVIFHGPYIRWHQALIASFINFHRWKIYFISISTVEFYVRTFYFPEDRLPILRPCCSIFLFHFRLLLFLLPLCVLPLLLFDLYFSLLSNYCQVSYCLGIWSLFLLFIEKFYFKTFSLFIIIHLCLFLFIVQFNFYRVYKVGFISFLYNRKTQNNSGINIIEFSGEVVQESTVGTSGNIIFLIYSLW